MNPPISELDLLLEIREEMRARLAAIEHELRLIAHEQQRLGVVVGEMVAGPRPTPKPTPRPASVWCWEED